ncbi:MAG: hypothetical protein CO030_02855 [Candidatus Magasanikbacteria bacterium CG_4_9_14_0_2_um_filter_42_11]|uniref:OmpR/PhoB-type domain-containing protein n=1 Tax=Candidatus Magasanikbacteria bacterium CG_4_9_14_0_2_um_filter_42_11 TaxID=1974643 RepID=A0A2M8F9M9_9BACT|nr:MAG: hypothetical protein COU34_02355 [Candidatus Magasanikbacteria bacterium CG10_big_fil_rev_8_21_14_0_10_43_9]PIY92853.1 MAG: hypothetical protein COY70_01065 [Candidatus Magasanikbacteria bacterium CG_4_10_14_0_8_um_filter_42_12]PJC52444.1 MAG: hypothetical protein CO030_02855 [Candidatus Magasanikbacteria bacterium CG_4_9_14_0_2_um_filter_42_11]
MLKKTKQEESNAYATHAVGSAYPLEGYRALSIWLHHHQNRRERNGIPAWVGKYVFPEPRCWYGLYRQPSYGDPIRSNRTHRGVEMNENDILKVGDIKLYMSSRRVTIGEVEVRLTEFEFITLWSLARKEGRVIFRKELREIVDRNDYNMHWDTRAADKLISRLRRAIGDDGRRPQRILTVHGKGYKLVPKMD